MLEGFGKNQKNLEDSAKCLEQNERYKLFKSMVIDLAENCIDKIPYFNNLLKSIIGKPDIYAVSNAKISEFYLDSLNTLFKKNDAKLNQ